MDVVSEIVNILYINLLSIQNRTAVYTTTYHIQKNSDSSI
jgi:hypothetical protein